MISRRVDGTELAKSAGMNTSSRFASLLVVALALPACAEAWDAETSDAALTISAGDAALVLDLVNYPATTVTVLDEAVGLDSRAATNILVHVAGADGVVLSADDDLFGDVAELDAIAYVGDAAFASLISYAHVHPAPTAESVEGVLFHGWEAEAVVWGVNNATLEELDVGAALDARAAQNLVAGRPYANVSAMGPVAYVGGVALGALRDYADVWFGMLHDATPPLAGTFDGVAFDEATAHTALDIANGATSAELTGHGMAASPAAKIVASRPYTTLGAVAALTGVGTATMTALHGYAQSGDWGTPATDCVGAFADAVQPHLAGLYFMSESDRLVELVSYPGEGTTAPTAASVLALVGAPAGSTALLRDPAHFFQNLEEPTAAAAIEAAYGALLTDVVYVAVIPPAPDDVVVQVYVVGRTACGDLVGLKSIAIET